MSFTGAYKQVLLHSELRWLPPLVNPSGIVTTPVSGMHSPLMMFRRVLLPQPLLPISTVISEGDRVRVMLLLAVMSSRGVR